MEKEVAASFLYDPITRRSTANTGSVRLDSAVEMKFPAETSFERGFTIEALVKIDDDPKKDISVAMLGSHGIGVRFLQNWSQSYWAGFSNATRHASWQTGHYSTISRLVPPTDGGTGGTLNWRHLAMVYHPGGKTMTAYLDRWQAASVKVSKPVEWADTLTIGRDFKGLIDEIRLTPRPLSPGEFLLPSEVKLEGVDLQGKSGRFPLDAGHYDVRAHFGAVGDGVHDDTAALNKALTELPRTSFVYLPNGTYLVSDTIQWTHFKLLIGESREGVLIKLKDNCEGFGDPDNPKPVIRCHYNQNESIMNFIQHLSVNSGIGNPGAIGIRYNSHNQGTLEDVSISSGDGDGVIGLDMAESEFGPALIKDLLIEGFDTGIKTPANVSHATMVNVSLRGQKVVGLRNNFSLSVYRFQSENSVPAIENGPGWNAQLTLINANLTGGSSKQIAIKNTAPAMYLRNIISKGYRATLQNNEDELINGNIDGEFLHGSRHGLAASDRESIHLQLPIVEPPLIFNESVGNWKLIEGGTEDDTDVIQAALDSGASTLYFRQGVDYVISKTLVIPPSVRRVFGMKASLTGKEGVFDETTPLIRIGGTAGRPLTIEHLSPKIHPKRVIGFELASARDVYFRFCHAKVINSPEATGRLFIDEMMTDIHLNHPQQAWIRQHDPETKGGKVDATREYLINNGGKVWVLGQKTEAIAVHHTISGGGQTELLGGFFRDHNGSQGVPAFRLRGHGSALSASYQQYAWRPGSARSLHAEIEGRKSFKVEPNNGLFGVFRTKVGD